MKKEYIKPLMESEIFVPDEYCSPCSFITCLDDNNCGSFVYNGVPQDATWNNPDLGFKYDGFDKLWVITSNEWYYSKKINGHEGHRNVSNAFNETATVHHVQVEDTNQKFNGQPFEYNGKVYGPNVS